MQADAVLEENGLAAPTVIDIEASGFGRGSYPIEVGFVLADGESWCSLVRPEPDWLHWDISAAAVHRIRRDSLLRHGRSCADVAQLLNQRLRGQTVYTDCWAHDYAWIARLYDAAERSPSFRLANLQGLLNDTQLARWDQTRAEVAARLRLHRHRASADARVLQQTLVTLRHAPAAGGIAPASEPGPG